MKKSAPPAVDLHALACLALGTNRLPPSSFGPWGEKWPFGAMIRTAEEERSFELAEEGLARRWEALQELIRRLCGGEGRPRLGSPEEALPFFADLRQATGEVLRVAILNARHELLQILDVATGGWNRIVVTPADVFIPALRANGRKVILAHNHPSGDETPSEEDLAFTRRLSKASQAIGISVVDHFILGRAASFSFRAAGLLDAS